MLYKLKSASLIGIEAQIVDIEIDVSLGLPGFTIVGLPDPSVKESKERVRAALKNSGYKLPSVKTTVNLAPADRKKEGAAFDLPIAIGLLAYLGVVPDDGLDKYLFLGELALDGCLKPVRGILSAAILAKKMELTGFILPRINEKEAALMKGIKVYGFDNIVQVVQMLNEPDSFQPVAHTLNELSEHLISYGDFCEIKGQAHVKRAMEVAAAGGHNVLLIGPPGAGKTMLAQRFPSILPPLCFEEIIEVTQIYSAARLLKKSGIVRNRPFRAPHHTITDAGLIGGGVIPRPGEVTLAHLGILFLDELPEFRKKVLEDLRQPLEDRQVTVSRVSMAITFPSSFILIAAMNSYEDVIHGHENSAPDSHRGRKLRYYQKISNPLLDRIDMMIEVPKMEFKDIVSDSQGERSCDIRKRVISARKKQERRLKKHGKSCNDQMEGRELKLFCETNDEGKVLLEMAVEKLGFSVRGYSRVLKVARTIADLEKVENISSIHISEAIQYRIAFSRFK